MAFLLYLIQINRDNITIVLTLTIALKNTTGTIRKFMLEIKTETL